MAVEIPVTLMLSDRLKPVIPAQNRLEEKCGGTLLSPLEFDRQDEK